MLRALTLSNVTAANDAGADVIKIFPASLNGPKVIVSLKGPFPGLAFMPTGGVSVANLDQWLATGVAAVGAGGELCSSPTSPKVDMTTSGSTLLRSVLDTTRSAKE